MANSQNQPSEGDKAPDFTLPAASASGNDEHQFTLSSLSKPVVLFFYPKDDTSGCTKEAVEFTAALPEFDKLGIEVVGVSPDPVSKHLKFRDKHQLGVTLVADEEQAALNAFGVWVEKSMYGKKYMGVERSTFLIAKDGTILKAWHKVKVPGHVEEVLAAAGELV